MQETHNFIKEMNNLIHLINLKIMCNIVVTGTYMLFALQDMDISGARKV